MDRSWAQQTGTPPPKIRASLWAFGLFAPAPVLDRRTLGRFAPPLCAQAKKRRWRAYGFHKMEPPSFGWRAGAARPLQVRQDRSPGTIRRSTMQNIAEFHIIGRIGKIDAAKDVTHLSVAANYNRRGGDEWKNDPHWNRVTLFGKLRDRLAKAATGDLVRITGRVRQTRYEAEGVTRCGVDMIANGFAILAKQLQCDDGRDDRETCG
jgi:single-strand DNA-binding protein